MRVCVRDDNSSGSRCCGLTVCGRCHQLRTLGVIHDLRNRAIPDTLDRFVDDGERDQEPLPRADGLPESVLDSQVQLGGRKDTMKEVLKLGAVDRRELVGCHYLDVSQ